MSINAIVRASTLLSVIILLMPSCSTTFEANRFSHLKYVKSSKGSAADMTASPRDDNQVKLPAASVHSIEIPEMEEASLLQEAGRGSDRSQRESQDLIKKNGSEQKPTRPEYQLPVKKFGQSILQESRELRAALKPAPDDLIYDQDKLLVLWLILTGAAIVFGLLTAVAWPFSILATLAAIAAIVFFVLWIVNIARS